MNLWKIMTQIFDYLFGKKEVVPVDTPQPPQSPVAEPVPPMPITALKTSSDTLYELAKGLRGRHLTLNEAVPWGVGCAEAVSRLLQLYGVPGIPAKGIASTAELCMFLEKCRLFREVPDYAPGRIILSETGSGNDKIRGHVGVCGKNSIMSNNSETGLWSDHWDYVRWNNYYHVYGGIPTRFFEPI